MIIKHVLMVSCGLKIGTLPPRWALVKVPLQQVAH